MKFDILVGLLSAIGLASACKPIYTQCDGVNYSGEKCCEPGLVCRELNVWYHYCDYPDETNQKQYQAPLYRRHRKRNNLKKRDNPWGGNWGNWGAWQPSNAPLNSAANNNPWGGNWGNFGNFGNNNNNNNNNNINNNNNGFNSWTNWGNWWDQGNNAPAQNVPAQNSPAQNVPTQNTPPQNAPTQNVPIQNDPIQNNPIQNNPAPAPAPENNTPIQTPESAPVQNNNNNNDYSANANVKWPKAQKNVKITEPIVVKAGQVYDGLKENNGAWTSYGRGVNAGDCKNIEGGGKDAVFKLETGATLKNVILGSDSVEHVHCVGDGCTVENVWWNDVCEDALSLLGSTNQNAKFYLRGGGAKDGSDKIVQHNSAGTVYINGFDVKNAGKLYRSCGNCKSGYQNARHVVIENVNASNVGVLAGINSNFGDTATFKNVNANGGNVCETFTGNNNGGEPQKIGSQCKGQANCSCK